MQQRGEFSVSVTKDYLVFASAHFITFAGHRCEGLHGHNYRVRVTLDGALDEESWFVFDFVALKHIMRELCDEIDHKVLLPLQNPKIQIAEDGESIKVAYEGRPPLRLPTWRLRAASGSRIRQWRCWRSCSRRGSVPRSRRPGPAV